MSARRLCRSGMLWCVVVLSFGFWGGSVHSNDRQQSSIFGGGGGMMVDAEVMRPYNLDYLDAETMAYYLEAPKHDHDIAVLFYAQWCKNCHAFAPLWDKIGRLIRAGSKDSNLIMGLFDCEENAQHQEICNMAGVKQYPTITFFSLSGQEFHRKQRKTKKNPHPVPRHSVQFSGNWQYGDAVYDWVRVMSGLSGWHRAGWGRKIRSLFSRTDKKELPQKIPLGIPPGGGGGAPTNTETSSSSSSSSLGDTTSGGVGSAAAAEKKAQDLQSQISKMQDIVVRSGVMLGSMLHPATAHKSVSSRVAANETLAACTLREDNGKNYTDAFQFLAETGGWDSGNNEATTTAAAAAAAVHGDKNKKKQPSSGESSPLQQAEDLVLRSCVMEISLDYCSRVSTQVTLDWLDQHENDLTDDILATIESDLLQRVEAAEPYCVLIDSCIQQDMKSSECRPPTCPFRDVTACRYVSTCFEPEVHTEYAIALKVTTSAVQQQQQQQTSSSSATSSSSTKNSRTDSGKGGRWGLF